MRTLVLMIAAFAALLVSCGSEPKPATAPGPVKKAAPKPADDSRRFPKLNLIGTEVVNTELMGKEFMPGGTLAHYRKGKTQYEMFVSRLPTATDSAILLPDWRKSLAGAKFIPSFGGYFGTDAGRPVFIFAKGPWLAGIAGLQEKDADLQGRILAGALN